jgi:hypothetical protein
MAKENYGMGRNGKRIGVQMILGLDVHGVIDKEPDKYAALARAVRSKKGGKVYIITGQSDTPELRNLLDNLGMTFDRLVSIQDELMAVSAPIMGYEEGRPIFRSLDWDGFKGSYCARNHVDLMIDDSPEYRLYFTTPFLLINK